MQLHHQRSHINDGLCKLNDKDLIQKVREAPTKLKKSSKTFLKKLQKFGVKLDHMGDLDFSNVKHPNMITYISKNEQLVKLTLMQADLEFEYPMKLEKMIVKSDIL